MPLPISPLADVPTALVTQAEATAVTRLAEALPQAAWDAGPNHELVVYAHSALEAALQDVVDRWTRSRSVLEITNDPTLADAAVAAAALSNFRITPRAGGPARGDVAVVLDGPYPASVPKGAVFGASGRRFQATEAFAARLTAESVLGPGDRPLSPLPDGSGRYQFTITVQALEDGSAGRLRRLTRLAPEDPFPRFNDAYAVADFAGGADAETPAELLARLADGVADRAPSTRAATQALVRTQFAAVQAVSEVGHGDAEQVRYNGLLPVASGGRRDVYLRGTGPVREVTVPNVPAVLVDAAAGVWQAAVGRDLCPGLYEVTAATPAGDPTVRHPVVGDVRGYDPAADDWAPDVVGGVQAAYSRYQTVLVRFADPVPASGTARTVDLVVRAGPPVAEVQAYLADRDRRPPGSDLLVKAAVPCFVGVGLTVRAPADGPAPDAPQIAALVAAGVNATGFDGRLTASQVAAWAAPALPPRAAVTGVELRGRVRRPDGTVAFLHGRDLIQAPDEPKRMVTRRTVAFYLDPADVAVAFRPDPAD